MKEIQKSSLKSEKNEVVETTVDYSLRTLLEVKPGNQAPEQRTSVYKKSLVFLPDNLKIGEIYEFSIKVINTDRNGRDLFVVDHFFAWVQNGEMLEYVSVPVWKNQLQWAKRSAPLESRKRTERITDHNPREVLETRPVWGESLGASYLAMRKDYKLTALREVVQDHLIIDVEIEQLFEKEDLGNKPIEKIFLDNEIINAAKHRRFRLTDKTDIKLVVKADGEQPVGHKITWGEDLPEWLKQEILVQLRICESCREAKVHQGETTCPTCQLHAEWELAKLIKPPTGGKKSKK